MKTNVHYPIATLISCFLLSTIYNWGTFFSNISPTRVGMIASVLYIAAWVLCNFLLRNNFSWIKFILVFHSVLLLGFALTLYAQNALAVHIIPLIARLMHFSNLLLSALLATYHGLSLLMVWTNSRLLLLLLAQECLCLLLFCRCLKKKRST